MAATGTPLGCPCGPLDPPRMGHDEAIQETVSGSLPDCDAFAPTATRTLAPGRCLFPDAGKPYWPGNRVCEACLDAPDAT